MTTGTYNFVSFIFNVAFVAEISTSECTSETFAKFGSTNQVIQNPIPKFRQIFIISEKTRLFV